MSIDDSTSSGVEAESTVEGVAPEAEAAPAPIDTEPAALGETPAKHPVVKPVRITRDKDVWWCDGVKPALYDVAATLTAGVPGATGGVFIWAITSGASIVDFENGADKKTKNNNNRIGIKSTDASATTDDVKVRCVWSHGNTASTIYHKMTVRAPSAAPVIDGPNDDGFTGPIACAGLPGCKPDGTCDIDGFRSRYTMDVRDQFGTKLPTEIEVNEKFGTFVDDFMGNTWPRPTIQPAFTTNIRFNDDYGNVYCSGALRPDPVNPSHKYASNKIKHADQTVRAGSQTRGAGRVIKTHKTQYFQGRGRQV